jgi:hypothetical protein
MQFTINIFHLYFKILDIPKKGQNSIKLNKWNMNTPF